MQWTMCDRRERGQIDSSGGGIEYQESWLMHVYYISSRESIVVAATFGSRVSPF
jgi:hypothetical protein